MESTHRNPVIHVLVVDDHTLMRKAVVTVIQNEPGLVVAGEARNGEEAVELACRLRPDVVLMDLLIPKVDGVEAISVICQQWPAAKILAFSVSSDDALFFAALRAGAVGYVTKTVEPDELLSAIRTVGSGASYLPSRLAQRLVNHFSTNDNHLAQRAERLTPRERDVVALVGQGCNNRTIAEMLGISAATVRIHLRHAQEKLGLRSRAQIAFFTAQYPLGTPAS